MALFITALYLYGKKSKYGINSAFLHLVVNTGIHVQLPNLVNTWKYDA